MFDLLADPHEQHNINASSPEVTARLLKRFAELSLLAQQTESDVLLPTVPPSAPRWDAKYGGSVNKIQSNTRFAC